MLGSAHGLVVDFAELSDPGRDPSKQVNEDASGYAETPIGHLAVVCDGMGGHESGREASQTAVRCIIDAARAQAADVLPGLVLKQALERAGRAVYALGESAATAHRPGSTCVALLLHPGGAEVAHAGDSRAYLLRAGQIERLTRDHSMVQELVDSGRLAPEHAHAHPDANQITRALGIDPEVAVEVRPEPLALTPGDVLVLATDVDGVYADFGTAAQRRIDAVTPAQLRAGSFAAGSMGPKVEAICRFVEQGGGRGAIGALEAVGDLVAGDGGTQVRRRPTPRAAPSR